ncbi:MAG: cupredoxin domain-containing protein [Acidimicrobiales bacterium]
MTVTADRSVTDQPPMRRPRRRRVVVALVGAVLAAAGIGTGLALSLGGSGPSPASSTAASYDYYQSVMGRYGPGSMMGGGSYGWMMGQSGYAWMMGGASAPEWMRGQDLPGFMMGGESDPGTVMGRLFADAPGPRVSPSEATRLGSEVPAGATADRAANRLTFSASDVHLVVLASPSMPAENFRIAGMTNPTVVVPKGATVSIEFVNADSDMAHGLVVTASGAASSWMPMMSAPPGVLRRGAVVLGRVDLGRHARRHPHLHRRHPWHLPVPLPGLGPRPRGDGGHLRRLERELTPRWRAEEAAPARRVRSAVRSRP